MRYPIIKGNIRSTVMDNNYQNLMSEVLANDIKKWKLDEGFTYVDVHAKFLEKYVGNTEHDNLMSNLGNIPQYGDSLEGIKLFTSAMDFLQRKS